MNQLQSFQRNLGFSFNTILFSLIALIDFSFLKAQSNPTKVSFGKIERISNFKSKFISARNIDIWLPEGYSFDKKYAVLYMHDGQMLFDPEITWNKQSWNVDEIAQNLIYCNKVKEFIVVGIWNGDSTRHKDYFPQQPFESMSKKEKDSISFQLKQAGRIKTMFEPNSDNYLKFITRELKPYIDKSYSVHKHASNTFIAGSSMGGLISIYGICEYPKVFGGAACISTHWPGTFTIENNRFINAISNYLKENLPNPKSHKIYFDCGDQTLDALYPEIQLKIDDIMKEKGFSSSNWLTKYYPGENHSELAWQKRLDVPLKFLLQKNSQLIK